MSSEVEATVTRDLDIDGERYALLIETKHGKVVARTAVHRTGFRRSIGGARFVRHGDVAEVGHLASGMTWKCAAAGIPADGQKSVIACGDNIPRSAADRAAILAAHIRAAKKVAPGLIFGPDMNNPEEVMDLLAAQDDLRDHVTGLSGAQGGLSIDTRGYTAHGVVAGVLAALRLGAGPCDTASIQGFGAVGAHSGVLLDRAGIRVNAASVVLGALIADSGSYLDVNALASAWEADGDAAFTAAAAKLPDGVRFNPDPDSLLHVRSDIFLPAARTAVLAMPDELEAVRMVENPQCQDVTQFAKDTAVRLVAQGANHPLTAAAERYLEEQHEVTILPDYIVNCGGLLGCFAEWVHRAELRADPSRTDALHRKTLQLVSRTVEVNVKGLFAQPDGARVAGRAIADHRRKALLDRKRGFPDDTDGHALARACLDALLAE